MTAVILGLLRSIIVGIILLLLLIGLVYFIAYLIEFIASLTGWYDLEWTICKLRKDFHKRVEKTFDIFRKSK